MRASNSVIEYLRDCYREDSRGGGVTNLFSSQVQHRLFFDSELLLSGRADRIPIHESEALPPAKTAQIYQREKELLYGVLPVLGRASGGFKGSFAVCAPLLLYPARLVAGDPPDEFLYLVLDGSGQRLNLQPLARLLGEDEDRSDLLQGFAAGFPAPPFEDRDWKEILRRLESLFPGLVAEGLGTWPRCLEGKQVEAHARQARRSQPPGAVACVAAAVAALVPRSRQTGGVLFELGRLAQEPRLSPPLLALLEGAEEEPLPAPEGSQAPAVLSAAQTKALRSAHQHALTVVTGPPGTGKSYTLAALALDHVSQGKSVLLAARGQQALDVLCAKVETISHGKAFVVKVGTAAYAGDLRRLLQEILSGMHCPPDPIDSELRRSQEAVQRIERDLARLEKRLQDRGRLEELWGSGAARGLLPWREKILSRVLGWRLARRPAYWHRLDEYERLLDARSKALAKVLELSLQHRLQQVLSRRRQELQGFEKALRAQISSRREELFARADMECLLRALPLWTVSFSEIHRVLPFVQGLFDLVIVDEATQCDLATCLPVLQRGRRAVITGDPKQLRHVSFLSRDRQEALARRLGLVPEVSERFDFRGKSLLDGFTEALRRQEQVVFLDEHFRSAPPIIEFSNRRFYGESLRVMTRTPVARVEGSLRREAVHGVRGRDGTNPLEAERVLEILEEWVEREQEVPVSAAHSLGVLSPFRAQAELLSKLVQERLSLAALEKHRILVGTPFAFQGEERDLMILSFAVDPASPAGSFRYLERPDVFNVAITRARSRQIIVSSLAEGEAPAGALLRAYLSYIEEADHLRPASEEAASDPFLEEVAAALRQQGFRAWPVFEVAGLVVDLVVERHGTLLGLDLVGQPGELAEAFALDRCRMLRRAGLPVFPLPLSAWRRDQSLCLQAIERRTRG